MNIYIIEDDICQIESMKRNIEDATAQIKKQWKERFAEIEILEIFTPDFSIKSRSKGIEEEKVLGLFKDAPPHILVLDWELYWGKGNETNFNGDELLKLIDSKSSWNPYVIFTSSKNPMELLNILGGKELTRIYPTSVMLLEKIFLTNNSRNNRGYSIVKNAFKQAMDYAAMHTIPLHVYPFPQTDAYCPTEVADQWVPENSVFIISDEVTNNSAIKINVSMHEIVAVLIGKQETYGLILFTENKLQLQLCHFSGRPGLNYFIRRFPFLTYEKGVFINNSFFFDNRSLELIPNKCGGNGEVDTFLSEIRNHIRTTDKYVGFTQNDLDPEKINRLYIPLKKFI